LLNQAASFFTLMSRPTTIHEASEEDDDVYDDFFDDEEPTRAEIHEHFGTSSAGRVDNADAFPHGPKDTAMPINGIDDKPRSKHLVVRVFGVKDVAIKDCKAAANVVVSFKISFRNLLFETIPTAANYDPATKQIALTLPRLAGLVEDLHVSRRGEIGDGELIIIRVKAAIVAESSPASLWRAIRHHHTPTVDLGIVTLSARKVASETPGEWASAWYPLSKYHDMDAVSGLVRVSVFWEFEEDKGRETSAGASLVPPTAGATGSDLTGTNAGHTDAEQTETTTPDVAQQRSQNAPSLSLYRKRVFGITIRHRTQESLIRRGACSQGLSPSSALVRRAGSWQDYPPSSVVDGSGSTLAGGPRRSILARDVSVASSSNLLDRDSDGVDPFALLEPSDNNLKTGPSLSPSRFLANLMHTRQREGPESRARGAGYGASPDSTRRFEHRYNAMLKVSERPVCNQLTANVHIPPTRAS
jgi:hypothetical protein